MYGFAADMPNTYTTKDGVTYTLSSSSGLTGIYYDGGSKKYAVVTYQDGNYTKTSSVILEEDQSGTVDEKGNVVYGEGNNANGYGNVIYGKSNSANAGTSSDPGRAVVIGVNNTANGIAKNSTIIGQFDIVNSPNTVAIGNNIQENGSSKGGTVIIGNYAHSDSSAGGFYDTNKKYIPAGIILGEYSFSRPSANTKEAYLKPSVVSDSNKDYWNATWTPTANPVSIGDVVPNSGDDNASGGNGHGIITRQINGVAAGSYDTDAVNVAQLKQAIAKWNQGGGGTGGSSIHFYHVNSTDSSKGNYNNDGAKGTDALAAGVDAQAIGDRSTAVGNGAKAILADTVALGSKSVANRAKWTNLTDKVTYKAYAKPDTVSDTDRNVWEATDNAIAVGNDSTTTRQITGVAAGSLDTDAVNVAQLKAVQSQSASAGDLWTAQASGSDVKAANQRVNFVGKKDGHITVKSTKDGEITFETTGLADTSLRNITNEGNTVIQNATDVVGTNGIDVKNSTAGGKKTYIVSAKLANNLVVDQTSGNIDLADVVNIGGTHIVKVDGNVGDITGLMNKTLDADDFAKKGRAATEEQLNLVYNTASQHTKVSAEGTTPTDENYVGGTNAEGNILANVTTNNGAKVYDLKLNKDVVLGEKEAKKGGSITVNNVAQFRKSPESTETYDVGEAVKIDGNTVSIVKVGTADAETGETNEQRQVVLGIGQNTGGYIALNDSTGKKHTYIYNAISDGNTYLNSDTSKQFNRLEYSDYLQGSVQFIATLGDGMKYAGDDGQGETEAAKKQVISKELNNQLDIIGGATAKDAQGNSLLTDNNIGVNNVDGKLKIQLVKDIDLTQDGSVKMGNTTINNGGVTINHSAADTTKNVTLTNNGLDNGGNKIINVTGGTNDTDAVNVAQLKNSRTTVKSSDQSINVKAENEGANKNHVYDIKVNYDNVAENTHLSYKANNGTAKTVTLDQGLNFTNGTNTTAVVGDNGVVKFDVADSTIKDKAREAVIVEAGANVTVEDDTTTADTTKYKVSAADMRVKEGQATYNGVNGTATLTMNDGSTATINGLKNEYVNGATVATTGSNKNHITLTHASGESPIDIDLNGVLASYSTSDYQLVGSTATTGTDGKTTYSGDYKVGEDGSVTLNVADTKGNGQLETVKITGLASTKDIENTKTHYYSVIAMPFTAQELGDFANFTNYNNDGSKKMGSLAAGYLTYANGIASTVTGSLSGVINRASTNPQDFRGATAVSYGTFNINDNSANSGKFSGVANSIVGQANMTSDSNASLIYGAGNVITNSYRDIDASKLGDIVSSQGNPQKLGEALQAAVPQSGGQVMAFGGGNTVDTAYMTQVIGVGNTVKGDQAWTSVAADAKEEDKKAAEESNKNTTQLNYVDGFYTKLTNGKNDYLIGAHNTVTGDSVEKNKSNIVFGDNHTLENQSNNIIIGSADTKDTPTKASNAVIIGHNANVSVDDGVAIGSGSVASTDYGSEGYDISKNSESSESTDTSATWQATKAAVSVGSTTKDSTGKVTSQETRQITNLAAGTLDTDAVNVAQLKQVKSFVNAKGLKFVGNDGKEVTRKLNETLSIKGGITDATALQNASTKNLGVRSNKDSDGLEIVMTDTPDFTKVTVGGDTKKITIGGQTVISKKSDGSNGTTETGNYATGLDNKDWNVKDPAYVSGRAATEDQLKKISDAVNDADTKAGKHTVVTVNDKANATEATAGKGDYGAYSSTDKGNLLIAAKDNDGQMTYNIKLNDQLAIGKDGKDGKDGKVTVETRGGTTVVIGHDGKDGEDGKDGLFVNGKDGQDGKSGVSIIGPNGQSGADGIDGKVGIAGKDGKDAVSISGKDGAGHIGLTGPKGENGTDAIDIHTDYGVKTLDTNKNVTVNGKEKASRIIYTDSKGDHEVATMDDGLKFVGNDDKTVVRKLNTTLSIKGGITDATALQKASTKNLGVRSNKDGDGLEIVMTDTPDFTKVTVGGDNKITIGGQTNSDTKNPANGNYITGLDNTKWDKDYVTENRAATEGQLRDIAGSITNQNQGGGFALTSDEKGADKIVKQDLGKAIQIKGDTTYKADGTVEKAGNIKTSIDNGAIKVELNKDVDLTKEGSIKVGETTIDKDVVKTNEVKVGDITITKDGINGGAKQITKIASGITGNTYADAGDNNAASIGDVKQLAKNEAKASEAKSGKNITVKDDHTVNLNDDITLGNDPNKQVAINGSNGQVVIGSGDSAMTLGKQSNTARDSNPAEGNYLNGLDNRKWDGEHIQNGRAATEDQLKTVSDKVNSGRKFQGDDGKEVKVGMGETLNIKGGATEVSDANNIGIVRGDDNTLNVRLAKDLTGLNSVTTGNTTINNGGLTIKTSDENRNITVQDGNINMGGNQIHNVAPGQAPRDAVNVSQLNATNQTVANLGGAVNKLGTRVNRVGAGAAALAALHPLDFDPDDKWDFAAGYGNYRGANAAAVGAYYRPNEDTMFSIGGSFGGGENMVNAGVSFKVGQGNHVSTSRVAMAKEIKDLRQNVANLNAIVNRQSALIDKLTGTNAGMIKDKGNDLFPDVPANHWAYEYVTKLKQAGILTGYPDGNFDGDRMMTRYEFAAIVYRAIMAGAASNPALNQDGTLNKLAKEFSPEMKYIRIDTIAKDKNDKPTIERVRVIPDAK